MTEINLLRSISAFLSFSSVPPSVFLFWHLLSEDLRLHPKSNIINRTLRVVFFLTSLGGTIGGLLSAFLALGFRFANDDFTNQIVFNARNIILASLISFMAWSFSFIVIHERNRKVVNEKVVRV